MKTIKMQVYTKDVDKIIDLAWYYKLGYIAIPNVYATYLSLIDIDIPEDLIDRFNKELKELKLSYCQMKVA